MEFGFYQTARVFIVFGFERRRYAVQRAARTPGHSQSAMKGATPTETQPSFFARTTQRIARRFVLRARADSWSHYVTHDTSDPSVN